jgi:hypothetical protein
VAITSDLIATHLLQRNRHLRLLDEVAGAQAIGDALLGFRHRQARQGDAAQQRVGDRAGFGQARFQRQVRALINRDADHVARGQTVLGVRGRGRALLCPHQARRCHQQQRGRRKQAP